MTDNRWVFARGRGNGPLDVLVRLPKGFEVVDLGGAVPGASVVVGATGVFVLIDAATSPAGSAAGVAADLAVRVREHLADHLAWVPFVDPLVVGPAAAGSTGVTTVGCRDLAHCLVHGPHLIDPATVQALADLVRRLPAPDAAADGTQPGTGPHLRRAAS